MGRHAQTQTRESVLSGRELMARLFLYLMCAGIAAAQGITATDPAASHNSGQDVTAVYEGWYPNPDGSSTILFGYYNRNTKQVLDISVGRDNRIEPGGPDQGQPTHFLTGRQWGMFTVTVPKDFGPDKRLTWTIVSNGKTTTIPAGLNPLWLVSPFKDATGNTPPFIAFDESGPFLQGPPRAIAATLHAAVGQPLPLNVWVADDAIVPPPLAQYAGFIPAVSLTWTEFRGPGTVMFDPEKPKVAKATFKAPSGTAFSGKSSVSATFSDPGEYILEITANDLSGPGGAGFQCCWTSAQVKVSVSR